ncbi:hypothetical protein [Campylobacter mucosalis]|uniref:hypothetical protein n=1 Tax=Campylobacter mucosalis TaxID=202 RepID=UPI00146FE145|nr:hypothetical protein [Campylobacter mucosalis]
MGLDEKIYSLKQLFLANVLKFCTQNPKITNKDYLVEIFDEIFNQIVTNSANLESTKTKISSLDEQTFSAVLNFALLNLILSCNDKDDLLGLVGNIRTFFSSLEKQEPEESLVYEHPINSFKRMQDDGTDIVFLNLYDGVNISYQGHIIEIDDSSVVFSVDIMQILAMKQEKNAYIVKNSHLAKHIKAEILEINIADECVRLGNFTYIDKMSASLRTSPRVHPSSFTRVKLTGKELSLNGNIYDISKGGLSVLGSQDLKFDEKEILNANFDIFLDSSEPTNINLELELVAQINYNGFMRYCMQLTPNNDTKVFENFIDRRVDETLEELRKQVNLYR